MTRHLLALAAATAFGAAAAPAVAQDGPPPPPARTDPQSAPYPAPPPASAGPDGYGAPYAHPLPPGVYPGRPYPPQAMPYPAGSYPHGPMAWRGEGGPAYGGIGSSYWYVYQTGGAPCGCPGYTWVPVPVETHYRYSAPVRHVEEVVEEKVVREQVVEKKVAPVRREVKYVKTAPAKVTKSKVVKRAK